MCISLAKRSAAGVLIDSTRPYLTIQETAALLALSMRNIHRYITEGKLEVYRVACEKVIRIEHSATTAELSLVQDLATKLHANEVIEVARYVIRDWKQAAAR